MHWTDVITTVIKTTVTLVPVICFGLKNPNCQEYKSQRLWGSTL